MTIESWIKTLLVLVGLFLLWLLNSGILGYGEPSFWLLYILAMALTLTGCYVWTRLKNRHPAFALWGLLTPIGLLGIALLKNKTPKSIENENDTKAQVKE